MALMRAKYPDETAKWVALNEGIQKVIKEVWPGDSYAEDRPAILIAGQFGTLPAPIHSSTMGLCHELAMLESLTEVVDTYHDKFHGIDPETGLAPMSQKMTYQEALDAGVVGDESRERLDALIESGYDPDDIVIIKHVTSDDLDELEITEEVTYDTHPGGETAK